MNKQHLDILIRLGEGFTVEFKRSGTSNVGRELCAFANATGGTLLIGITDDGEICGVDHHNRLKSVIQSVARTIEPSLFVDIESVGDVLVVTIPPQNGKPYSHSGKFYLREGASSQQLSRNEIREFFFREGMIHFDEMVCDRFSMDTDLTESSYIQFARKAKIPDDMNMIQALENLHLVRNGLMTHAGSWLLAADIQKFMASGFVSCALFMGTSRVNILDRKNFTGNLQDIFQDVITWLLSKLNTEFIITGTGRDERPELPADALREALVNALVHRDYRSNANVQVHMYSNRVEIISPGGLPAGMKEEDMGLKSIPRNPLLFSMFYRMDLVEQIGSGIKRMQQLCRDHGVQEPALHIEDNWV
ncbi:MAG: ATP-binding protein, partial [Pseudomonadota bacterium]|nr:ATP-binding protein [Pseudomonadota bacterium]